MSWRLAYSLDTLRTQINAMYPNRSKLSDGTIGDTAHAASVSDHNPNEYGVVTALDLTHDPANGLDIQALADELVATGDNRIKYLIANSRIWEPGYGWQPYYGDNPHDKHLHISVVNYDDPRKWNLKGDQMLSEDDVRYGYLAVTRHQPTQDQLNYWVGRTNTEFLLALWKLSDHYIVARENKIVELTKALSTYQVAAGDMEATMIGKALIKLFQTFGYKKG